MPLAIESDDLTPLPDAHRQGLIAVSVLASLSFGSSLVVLLYLTYKLIRWHFTTRWRPRNSAAEPVDLSLGLAERHFTGAHDGTQVGASGKKPYPNQFLVLIYNLLLADLHQAGAFLLNGVWARKNGIEVHNPACFLQGWLVSTGDLASSCFITAIAVHTYLAIVWNYRPPQRVLYATIVGLWMFDYTLALLGPVTTKNGAEHGGFYVRAAAWCWVSVKFETHRLVLHYLFIFISLAATSALYILIFFSLRKRESRQQSARSTQRSRLPDPSPTSTICCRDSSRDYRSDPENQISSSTIQTKDGSVIPRCEALVDTTASTDSAANTAATSPQGSGHHKAFLLYPVIYVVCTAPLALGRIATMAKVDVPISYFCVAGALIGSNGWLDVLLWGVTRKNLLFYSDVGSEETGLGTFTFMRTPHDRRYGNIVWVEGASGPQREANGNANERNNEWTTRGEDGLISASKWHLFDRIRRRIGWKRQSDFGIISLSSEKGHNSSRLHGRTVSQESLRGNTTRSFRQPNHHQDDHEGAPMPMGGGIHMDMVTSVVVVERPDLEKENREYLEQACGGTKRFLMQYCKNSSSSLSMKNCRGGQGHIGNGKSMEDMDLPELQDPSGYLTSASVESVLPTVQEGGGEVIPIIRNLTKKKEVEDE
ncbi:G protein-coupled glucose receptor regulating Gpa2-domain-containing protein [Rhypophila decipiens]|uniref:G protein-coupled glucose receptor regulating Gpa2-domain-containing protein n=1 Tax=Rhypophila decipiens TaxID=261697 RepID=A0AAN7B4L7_9PEZI|nr:G protein-coupled glucose receptor regulating Gpa2-domain-containing protein [Rhypophila decipiens]